MIHNITDTEEHLDARQKFMAREVEWFDPRPSRWLRAIVPSLVALVALLALAVMFGAWAAGGQ